MTTLTDSVPGPTTTEEPRGSGRRWWLLVGTLLLVAVLALLLTRAGGGTNAPLGPDNPKPDGAKALAQVLKQHGVEVVVVRDQAALRATRVDADTTVFVAPAVDLSMSTARALRRVTRQAGAVVVTGVESDTAGQLGIRVQTGDVFGDDGPSVCAVPLLAGLDLESGDIIDTGFDAGDPDVAPGATPAGLPRQETAEPSGVGCFPGLGEEGRKLHRLWVQSGTGPSTWLLGAPGVLTNGQITEADNAAIALRMLGQHERLVWYVPNPRDVPAGDLVSVSSQLPRGLFPVLGLVTMALLALMLARGRRLGRLVVEPLPVQISAIEGTRGRGRLYRKANDRDHAARILRRATRARLAQALDLPPETTLPGLLEATAARSGQPVQVLHPLLGDGPVGTDEQLAALGRRLAHLEREVRPR